MESTYLAVIKVVGAGGGGTNAVSRMIDAGIRGVFAHGWPLVDGASWMVDSERGHPGDIRRLRERHFSSDDQLLTLAMAARGPEMARRATWLADLRLARELGIRSTIHMGAYARNAPVRGIAQMHAAGVLGDDLTFVHCCHSGCDEIAIGVPFFIPPLGAGLTIDNCGEQITDKNWVDRWLMPEPIFIDFDDHGCMMVENDTPGVVIYSNLDDFELESNIPQWIHRNGPIQSDTVLGVALFNVTIGAMDNFGTRHDIYKRTAEVAQNARDVARDAMASIEAMKATRNTRPKPPRNPFPF